MFMKPADDIAGGPEPVLQERVRDGEDASVLFNNPYVSMSIQQQRTRLPIFKHRNHILYLLEKFRAVVVVGETGSGKSTQLPQYLTESGWTSDGRSVLISQPRRVAAVSLAARVAEEMSCSVGSKVGYAVRFDDATSDRTVIKYVTDGILLREMMDDPLLTKYSVIIMDEAHERSINTELALGLLRKVMTVRDDLRLIVSSATIDAEVFRDFFETDLTEDRSKDIATIVSIEGRMYPVSVFYTKMGVPDYVQMTVETVLHIHKTEPTGDILAFVTGMEEVERICAALREEVRGLKNLDRLIIVPLYGGLPAKEQIKVFDSTAYRTRKVVVATNIAETSVTIPGVCYVIDCGFVKLRAINPKNGIETLMTVAVSKSSAEQRAGRAGRVKPGKCFRLYPESELEKLMPATVPEIQRTNLAPVILQLKALGVNNVAKFDYVSRPPSSLMIQGLQLLYALGALDDDGMLTVPTGLHMAELPLSPMQAKALITATEFDCSEEIVSIIAMMQIQDVFVQPSGGQAKHAAEVIKRKFAVEEGDHMTMLNVYTAFKENGRNSKWCHQMFLNYKGLCRAESIREQLVGYMKRRKAKIVSCRGTIGETAKIRRCLLTGFFTQAARYTHTGDYVTVREEYPFKVYKGSSIMYRKEYPKWVLFTDVLQNSIRDISEIEPEWLYELAPHYYDFGTAEGPDNKRRRTENFDASRKANLN
ncbi:DEAH protein box protein [Aphelenchoides avenae]|nr:DEAH protein box protein [Aphelenchus avenae]